MGTLKLWDSINSAPCTGDEAGMAFGFFASVLTVYQFPNFEQIHFELK